MNAVIVACRTLEKELLAAMGVKNCTYPILWLEAGRHNVPESRRQEIQHHLDSCTGYDTVILAASLCGNLVVGLQTHNFQMIVPRCDDCITLLLGSAARRNENAATYFLTDGWLSGKDNIWTEYQRTLEKYGEIRGKRIFSSMLAHYEKLAFVDTGCGDVSAQIQDIAAELELDYTRLEGSLSYLEELLSGSWDERRFLVVPPHAEISQEMCAPHHRVTILPENRTVFAPHGANLLTILQQHGAAPDAPCGGKGKCGKCKVLIDGQEVLSCKTAVTRDLTVTVPESGVLRVLDSGIDTIRNMAPVQSGHLLAFDIGTTSVVCYLLDGKTGKELANAGMTNPQTVFGGDVISRIQAALRGQFSQLTAAIRECVATLTEQVCRKISISPDEIGVISVVGNPAMQQLFLGICPENLAAVPFAPVLTQAKIVPCGEYISLCPDAALLIVPDISGFVGADTLGCVLSTKLYKSEQITLLVDIGTNGEMVLGNKDRLIACSTAAGPALEGANIQFGMRGTDGAIDHVWLEEGQVRCSVIGGGKAAGICGSGLIDAVAVALELGLLNKRGRIRNEDHIFRLTDDIYLTQEDIRQVQMAKGAIHAGITLMAKQLGIPVSDIQQVLLAGAFGAHLDPDNACRMGLLPPELAGKITSVGNAAGSGAKMLACDRHLLEQTNKLVRIIEFLELASLPEFPKTFAKAMGFPEE